MIVSIVANNPPPLSQTINPHNSSLLLLYFTNMLFIATQFFLSRLVVVYGCNLK